MNSQIKGGEKLKLKKVTAIIVTVISAVLLLTSTVNAAPIIQIAVSKPYVNASDGQTITVTVNKGGLGIIFVVQPDYSGRSWLEYIDAHPNLRLLWNKLPDDIRNQISEDFGEHIVSYNLIDFRNPTGGQSELSFPDDFTDFTGKPSTSSHGEYKAIFVYVTSNGCFTFKLSFDCVQWFALPESPFGSAVTILTPLVALAALVTIKKAKCFKKY